jgi:hypothetical protein
MWTSRRRTLASRPWAEEHWGRAKFVESSLGPRNGAETSPSNERGRRWLPSPQYWRGQSSLGTGFGNLAEPQDRTSSWEDLRRRLRDNAEAV